MTIVVTASPPVANNDTATTPVSTPVAINVLANDTDPNSGGALIPSSVAIVAGPGHGTVAVNPSTGWVTYTPAMGFFGLDQFSYTVSDNFALTSNVATVSVQVRRGTDR